MKMKNNKIGYFILSHKRAGNQLTLKTLKKNGIQEDVYIVVDSNDEMLEDYKRIYDNVIVFDKEEYETKTDTIDIEGNMDVVLYARNFAIDYAKQKRYEYIVVLDDDLKDFHYRYVAQDGKLKKKKVKHLKEIIKLIVKYEEKCNISIVSFGNDYDYIGGANGGIKEGIRRKANGIFIINLKHNISFISRFNEDVVTCWDLNKKGYLVFSFLDIQMKAVKTRRNIGGMEDCYKSMSDYNKAFYGVISSPENIYITVDKKGELIMRKRNNFPKIVSERYKKYDEA